MKIFIGFILLCAVCLPVFSETSTETTETIIGFTTTEIDESESGSGNDTATTTPAINTTTQGKDGNITTTPAPTTTTKENCQEGDLISENDCNCVEDDFQISSNGYCAKPCDPEYYWCGNGEVCDFDNGSIKCSCMLGFYESEEGTCTEGKLFGGEITFTNEYKEEKKSETMQEIEEILNFIYNGSDGFVKVDVLDVRPGSTIAPYQMTYNESGTVEVVENAFEDIFKNCSETQTLLDYSVNCTASRDTVIVDDFLCNNTNSSFTEYCDESSSECKNRNGIVWCECKEDFSKLSASERNCSRIVCSKESGCNDPFGSCVMSEENALYNFCDCMWGFTGTNCKDAWLFIFTIVTSGLGLILIIVIIVLICKTRKIKSHKKNQMPEDLNLKNPFVDFQPGLVRAKMPSSMNQAYDSLDLKEGVNGNTNKRNSYSNGAYNHGLDDPYQRNPSTFQHEYQTASLHNPGRANDTDYF